MLCDKAKALYSQSLQYVCLEEILTMKVRESDKRTHTEFIHSVVYSQVISEQGAMTMGYLEKCFL